MISFKQYISESNHESLENLLKAIHFYNKNFDIKLKPEHLEGIDFSTGSHDDHLNAIAKKLDEPIKFTPKR
jgi:hypothetical protein